MRSVEEINTYIRGVKPRNANALQLKKSWITWYNALTWYQKTSDRSALSIAMDRVTAYDAMNGGSQIGAEGGVSHRTIRLGSTGDDVSAWQGVIGAPRTGSFDDRTLLMTRQWQRENGLKDDGVVGPATWAKVPVRSTMPLWQSLKTYGGLVIAGLFGIGVAVVADKAKR